MLKPMYDIAVDLLGFPSCDQSFLYIQTRCWLFPNSNVILQALKILLGCYVLHYKMHKADAVFLIFSSTGAFFFFLTP